MRWHWKASSYAAYKRKGPGDLDLSRKKKGPDSRQGNHGLYWSNKQRRLPVENEEKDGTALQKTEAIKDEGGIAFGLMVIEQVVRK